MPLRIQVMNQRLFTQKKGRHNVYLEHYCIQNCMSKEL